MTARTLPAPSRRTCRPWCTSHDTETDGLQLAEIDGQVVLCLSTETLTLEQAATLARLADTARDAR
jgi:hypothetical protein